MSRAMSTVMALAAMAGLGGVPIIQPRKGPRMPLEDDELEKLASFTDDKPGRKEKRKYVKELEAKYRALDNLAPVLVGPSASETNDLVQQLQVSRLVHHAHEVVLVNPEPKDDGAIVEAIQANYNTEENKDAV